MSQTKHIDLRPSEARVLEVIRANPGMMSEACAERAGVAFTTFTHAILTLRYSGLIAPHGLLVPTIRVDLSRLNPRHLQVLSAICDGFDTVVALHESKVTLTRTTANRLTNEMRKLGALEPPNGLFTQDEVGARQDAAWDAIIAAERAAPEEE
jgi:hypothetical protein